MCNGPACPRLCAEICLRPALFLCTTHPQKRTYEYDAFSSHSASYKIVSLDSPFEEDVEGVLRLFVVSI